MRLRDWLALAARESRGSAGRLTFFVACLAVGVAAVVAVAGLGRALDDGIRARARQLLAADLAVTSRRPIEPAARAAVAALPGVRTAEVRELASVVSVPAADGDGTTAPGPSLLCELKGVAPGYPFYGELETDPARPVDELLGPDRVLVGPELLRRLDVAVGDRLKIGSAEYRIAGTVLSEPDRLEIGLTLGPRVLLSLAGLERSALGGPGSRVSYRLLAALPDGADVEAAAATVRDALPDAEYVRVETARDAQPALRSSLRRVGHFLGVVALLSLLIGGVGVAQAVRAWLAGRLHAIAVLRALGVRPREVLALYLGQTVLLALVGSTAGALAGSLVARALPSFLSGLLPVAVTVGFQPAAIGRGLALGVAVAVLFALRPLADAARVSPLRVLRRDAEPLPLRRWVAVALWLALAAGVAATAAIQSGSLLRGLEFTAGMAAVAAVLTFGAWAAMRFAGRATRERGTLALRHGLAALARPGAGTLGAVVALGLGVVTVLGMQQIQASLSAQLDADLPADAPTTFLVDIQPQQWPGVRRVLADGGARDVDSVEVVTGRLRAINGVPVSTLLAEVGDDADRGRRRWVFTREQRLTSMATLPADNTIVDGALWSEPDRPEVSVERDFADDLGVGVGDTLSLDVQGVPLDLDVTSIRTVDWGRFTINFFLVVEPGVLDGAPSTRIATARLSETAEDAVQDRLAAAYPNVTLLRLRQVLAKVVSVLRQVGFGVRLLGGFTVLAGIAILAGAVAAQAVRRGREVALYKTLGMTRAQVAGVFAVEYALVGVLAGLIGTAGGLVLAWAVVRFGLEIDWSWPVAAPVVALAVTVGLSVVAGLAASVRALAVRPLAVLRQGE